ncbi:MAG: hypothetical protein KF898_03615 [Parachlamydiales bacterium]|nr:hypothetical protein [Candidatus Acheromyda pituitae]
MRYLSSFLPYCLDSKKNGNLRTALKEYQALINASAQALKAFHSKEYQKLDGLVGENACEIRAIWLCCFALKKRNATELEKQLIIVGDALQKLLEPATINALMQSDISLKTLLEKEELNIPLNSEELFLIASFVLTEVKSLRSNSDQIDSIFIKERVDSKKLLQYGEITPSFANNLLSKLRKTLAAASVQYVREKAFALQDADLITMVSDPFTLVHNALPCIPMYWTYQTVLATAQQEGIPIIVHAKFIQKNAEEYSLVDEEKLFYEVGPDGSYRNVQPTTADLEKPACIIQGIATIDLATWSKSEWKARMRNTSIIDVILAGAADHRQYPDAALDSLFDGIEDRQYAAYKQLALKEGFAAENPTTFFIQHVYAALTSTFFSPAEIATHATALQYIRRIFARELALAGASS